ncbi:MULTISPECIES: WD40 repeat domain-containing protein [unclassified Bradyrhizobium]|uniref:WD40 repeat domain-containing protein n=1 Tax=unclassified Bradyrhizobium TaxID=2631580 RepID=UPI0028F15B41|nr:MULTISPECIES: WD40 repeat domain-containing protein [unclassified Bradyrhizobium]
MIKHSGPISGVSTSRGRYVATAGYDNQVILWDAGPGRSTARGVHDHLANQCQFNRGGDLLVSASSDYTARIWEVPTMRLRAVCGDHRDDVEMAIFLDEAEMVVTCSRDYKIRSFGLDGALLNVFEGHEADVISVVWEPKTGTLVSSSDDGTVRRWDPRTGSLLNTVDLDNVETDTVVITDRGVILAGNDDGEIVTVSPSAGRVQAHEAGIKRLVWSQATGLLVSMSYDRQAAFWSVEEDGTLRERSRSQIPAVVWPRSCAFLDSRRLVTATFGSTFASYDLRSREWDTSNVEAPAGVNAVRVVEGVEYTVGDAGVVMADGRPLASMGSLCNFLLPVGQRLVTGGQLGQLFDAKTGKVLYQHRSPLNCGAAFIRNGEPHAVIGTYTGEGLIFRLGAEGLRYLATVQLDSNAIKGVACSSSKIFAVCATADVSFHSIENFSCLARITRAHSRIANGCTALGESGFASVGRDLKLRIWSGGESVIHDTPHKNSIKCVSASSDGRWIATGSYGGMVAIFDVAAEDWCHVSRPTAAGVSSIAAVAGSEFAASSYDGEIYRVSV